MNKKIISVVALLIVVFGVFIYTYEPDKRYSWYESYDTEEVQPYGIRATQVLMRHFFGGKPLVYIQSSIAEILPDSTPQPANYCFIGAYHYPDSADVNQLLRFVSSGNKAFISSQHLSEYLITQLYEGDCTERTAHKGFDKNTGYIGFGNVSSEVTDHATNDSIAADMEYDSTEMVAVPDKYDDYQYDMYDTSSQNFWGGYISYSDTLIQLQFNNPQLAAQTPYTLHYKYRHDIESHYWHYFDPYFTCNQLPYTPLGYVIHPERPLTNFLKVPYGDKGGAIYLHTTPLVFTNYHIADKQIIPYIEKTLSHLHTPGVVYWDNASRAPQMGNANRPIDLADSPLKFLMQQRAFRWAWYLLLSLVFVYIVFSAKRRQRQIPILLQNTNTSLEFTRTIGKLYFHQQQHYLLCEQKWKMFLAHIRNRYNLSTRQIDNQLATHVAQKSGVATDHVQHIFDTYQSIQKEKYVTDERLIYFHQLFEHYYRQAK
jgi:hypothetical protein